MDKLLVLSQVFYPEPISTGQILTELCEELVNEGIDVKVICGPTTIIDTVSKTPKHINYHGIKIERVWGTRFPKLNSVGRIINSLTFALSVLIYLISSAKDLRPVMVLSNPPFLVIICALLKMLRIGPDFIYLIHDVYPDTAVELGVLNRNGLVAKIWNGLNKFVFRHAAYIVVIGRCMKNIIDDKVRALGVTAAHKVKLIPLWGDRALVEHSEIKDNPFAKKTGLTGKFVIGYSGNMGRVHDMETIMAAANKMSDRTDIIFLFIGDGYKKSWMQGFVKENQLNNCVFEGYVKKEDLVYAFSSFSVALVSLLGSQTGLSVPSKTYGFMAAGNPVIGILPDESEIAMLIREQKCGTVVAPGDTVGLVNAIENIYADQKAAACMAASSLNAVKSKYNIRTQAEAYHELISSLNNNGPLKP